MQDTEFIKHIGKIIRFYRLKNNLTQEQLSEYADAPADLLVKSNVVKAKFHFLFYQK